MRHHLERRFNQEFDTQNWPDKSVELLSSMAGRGSCRRFKPDMLQDQTIELLCAISLSAPTKSDLQQRDIILLEDPKIKAELSQLVGSQDWVEKAPYIAVFCGNNRRQRMLSDWRGHSFANDHLDAFFNAAVDAGIALATFVTAAEALGLGCCPISAVRNQAKEVSTLLNLPDHVFPVAGLAFGIPAASTPTVSPRLPLGTTVHRNTYQEADLRQTIDEYDHYREAMQPYSNQREPDLFGTATAYGWSEDKARQYALPERVGFGAFVKGKGFNLE